MADTKITALTAIGANPIIPSTFPIPMVDLTDTSMAASGTTKKVTVNQILQAGGTATLASATITGDLTVDTSTLKVDSANNFVGVGTTTGVNLAAGRGNLTIGGSSSAILNLSIGATDTGYVIHDGTSIYLVNRIAAGSLIFSTNSTERFRIASDGEATWSNVGGVAGTAMTLNATGLGVGDAPAANTRLTLGSVNPTGLNLAFKTTGVTTGRVQTYLGNTSGDLLSGIEGSTAGQTLTGSAAYSGFIGTFTNNPFYLVSNGLIRATIDSSGNVISNVTGTAPTLATNSQMVFNLTSNTNLRISVRGTDGVTRVANITLA